MTKRRALDNQLRTLPSMRQTFKDRGVFITGASGFLGGMVLERILRKASDVSIVYVLLRAKKGVSPQDRLKSEILDSPVRTVLRKSAELEVFHKGHPGKIRLI